jgi:diguanylate cyclase (GGDEF)-like protein/PAS domain S-box-containing protein
MSTRETQANLLQAFLEHIPDGVYFKDRDSRFVGISRSLAERFGLEHPSDALDKTDFDVFSDEHARQAFADEQEIIRTGRGIVEKEEKETWPDGHETWVLTTKLPLRDQDGNVIGTMGISRDITDRKRVERELSDYRARLEELVAIRTADLQRANKMLEQDIAVRKITEHDLALKARELEESNAILENISFVDHLTGLNNRKGFLAFAGNRMNLARQNGDAFSVAFIDLDGLKKINDSFGHEMGDRALIEVAGVLKQSVRQSDILARLGGDEFAVFVVEANETQAGGILDRIQHHLDACNAMPGRRYHLSFSIGIVSSPATEDSSVETLLGRADALMYQQKRAKTLARGESAGLHS